ncbi:MAG: pilus assembly protein CpaC [Humisphaera sp.]|nr:pilus assembly protein CpaC [Humisphaera sp.]
MRVFVKLASALTGRRGLSGMKWSGSFRAAAFLIGMIALATIAPHRAGAAAPPAVPPSAGGTAATTAPAPNVVAPGAIPGGQLVISGLDDRTGSVRLLVNKSTTLVTSRPYKRVSVGNEEIAEVNGIGTTRILVTGKKAGATQIIVWDEADNSQQIDVLVQANLLALRGLYERLLPGSQIDVIDNDGTIALTGQVPNLATAEQATALASGFGSKVLNLLEVAGGQQVMLQVRFAEVSKTATTALGINFGYTDGTSFGGSNVGQIAPFSIVGSSVTPDTIVLGVPPGGASVTQFGSGILGGTAFDLFVSAMRDNNLLRVLAEPNLVTTSGQEADFLAGGDFPIPIVQGGSTNGTAITVEFREFGVRLRFTPVVLGNGRIRLKMSPEVSDVDFTNAVQASGFRIPGRRTRRLSTTVELDEGQTFAVGGLLDSRVAANKSATPLLGDIPVLGALFRSVRYQRQDTELVVLVTPRLVSGLQPGQVHKLPGEHWRHPNEFGLYLFGDMGGEVKQDEAEKIPARRFIGSYGFVPAP